MKICKECDGAIADAGDVLGGYSGKWCTCEGKSMRTCEYCGGGIAEPGEVTGWAGKWCHCFIGRGYRTGTAIHIGPTPGQPYPKEKTLTEIQKEWDEFNKQAKGNVKKPSFSHILNLCEQLSVEELSALVSVLTTMVKK